MVWRAAARAGEVDGSLSVSATGRMRKVPSSTIRRGVIDIRDAEGAVRLLPHPGLHEEAVLGADPDVAGTLVGQEVAHPVHHELLADLADRLDDMGVVAEDEIDVGRRQNGFGLLTLGAGRVDGVLNAPVHGHDDELRPGRPGGGGIGQDLIGPGDVDQVALARRHHQPVQSVGVGQVPNGDAVDVVQAGNVFFGPAGGAGVLEAGGVEHTERVANPGLTLVDGVIGGHRAAVVPGPGDGVGQLGRRMELRVGRQVGAVGRQRHLEVTDGEIGRTRRSERWARASARSRTRPRRRRRRPPGRPPSG